MSPRTDLLSLETRSRIFAHITKMPGIHFRELSRQVHTGAGNLDHHLQALCTHGLIKAERSRGRVQFYPAGVSAAEREVLGVLRERTYRRILLCLLRFGPLTHRELVRRSGRSPSAITWYVRQLEDRRLLEEAREGGRTRYRASAPVLVQRLLLAHASSFGDRSVDRFVKQLAR
jgi:predicted transcriptional regulator